MASFCKIKIVLFGRYGHLFYCFSYLFTTGHGPTWPSPRQGLPLAPLVIVPHKVSCSSIRRQHHAIASPIDQASTKNSPPYQGKYIVILIYSLFTFCSCRLALVRPLRRSFLLFWLFICHVTVDTAQLGQVRVKAFLWHLWSVHPTLTTRDLPFILRSPPNSVLLFYSNTW